jgi:hypothetical protein
MQAVLENSRHLAVYGPCSPTTPDGAEQGSSSGMFGAVHTARRQWPPQTCANPVRQVRTAKPRCSAWACQSPNPMPRAM